MSSQSSSNLVAAMASAQTYLCRFGGPVFIFLGTVGCILNLSVFTQKTLRRSPCSIYFIAYNIIDLAYIYFGLLYTTVSLGYNIDPATYNLPVCRFRYYTSLLFHGLSQFYLILASVDRVLVTSRNALTRARSTHRLGYVCIVTGTIFWALFHSHALILTTITEVDPHYFICFFQQGFQASFVAYYTIIKETVVLSLMVICGLYSINNIRGLGRVRPVLNESTRGTIVDGIAHSASSKDRQLVFMLIVDITLYAVFSFVLAIDSIYQQVTQDYIKSPDRIQIENNLRNICVFSISIPCCTSFYANFIASKTFRNEVKKVLLWR